MALNGKGKAGRDYRAQRGAPPLLPEYTVANAPAASDFKKGSLIYVSNGSAGAACVAFSDGTNWKCANSLATIAAS